jgi:hypothetical protein
VALRGALVAVVLALTLFPISSHSRSLHQDQPALALSGRVDMVTGPNHTLLILVDQDTAAQPTDALVDLAFRLQRAPSVTFTGYATVTYVKNRVSVIVDNQTGWVFTVAGRIAPAVEAEAFLPHYEVLGLSRFWGMSVNATPAVIAAQLLSGGSCGQTPTSVGPKCGSCEVGGPEWTSCSMPCGEGTCEAHCADNQFACCNCPFGCGCCPVIQQQPSSAR